MAAASRVGNSAVTPPHIRTLIGALSLIFAIAIALAVPAAYYTLGAEDSADALGFKARLSASRVEKFIFANDRLWRYQSVRIAELIAYPAGNGEPIRQRVTDMRDKVVLQESLDLLSPVQAVRIPIVTGGTTIGWLDAEVSLRPLVRRTAYVAAGSGALGFVAWLLVRLLAIRALDSTLSRLAMESTRFQAALNNMTQGLCLFDARNRLTVFNRRFTDMFGVPTEGQTSAELGALLAPLGPEREREPDDRVHDLPDGRVIQVVRRPVPQEGWVATFEDITERRRTQARLLHMAMHDALTGLPNRTMFHDRLGQAAPAVRRGHSLAVVCIDLDGFTAVNDTLGLPVGDELLRQVANRLRENTRETDLVARLGGDEFAILQTDAEQPVQAMAFTDRLRAILRFPFDIAGQRIEIDACMGVMLASPDQLDPDELLRNADIALCRAQADGRGVCRFFEPAMDAEIRQRREMEADLRVALAEEQFEVFYQPLIDADSETLTGFEALIRWRHPVRGLVPPGAFIALTEATGLIKPIGAWVLTTACSEAARWPDRLKVAINLSPVQFESGVLAEDIACALATSGLAPHRLELEITESVLLRDTDATIGLLRRLHDLGVRISMDDFGTGYSSLSYLRRFPFDKIKIDRSFVQNLDGCKGSLEIVRAVVGLGKALGMDVLAEGVETEPQMRLLQVEGCDELQGYLFSKPRPAGDIPAMIAAFSPVLAAEAAD